MKQSTPMALMNVTQAVEVARSWGYVCRPASGKRGVYRVYFPPPRHEELVLHNNRPLLIHGGRPSNETPGPTHAGFALASLARIDCLVRLPMSTTYGALSAFVGVAILYAAKFQEDQRPRQEMALALSRGLRDVFPDVADMLAVHAHQGSI